MNERSGQSFEEQSDPRPRPQSTEPSGMGPTPSGPSFAPWQLADRTASTSFSAAPGPLGARPSPPPELDSLAPSRARLPALLTAALFVLVAAVVVAATLIANRNDSQVSLPSPVSVATRTPVPVRDNSIEFSTPDGSGRLVLLDHSWMSAGTRPPASGSYLQVQVELICLSGQIDYDPYYFQAFDAAGQLFDVTEAASSSPVLETGSLGPDERVRGFIAFDIPRGNVTLLMSNDSAGSVTALKIPD